MKKIAVSKFKERCLALLDQLGPEGLLVTKHGKPVARILPVESEAHDLLGALKNRLVIKGDILSSGVAWDAES